MDEGCVSIVYRPSSIVFLQQALLSKPQLSDAFFVTQSCTEYTLRITKFW